jgi:hypothetical protein
MLISKQLLAGPLKQSNHFPGHTTAREVEGMKTFCSTRRIVVPLIDLLMTSKMALTKIGKTQRRFVEHKSGLDINFPIAISVVFAAESSCQLASPSSSLGKV